MNNTFIVCFSNNISNLNYLLNETGKMCNSPENLIGFHDETTLLEWLKSAKFPGLKKLIIIDIEDSEKNSIGFIKSINQLCKNAIKLIIAENHQLFQIQKKFESNGLMQYLNRPWEPVDLSIAMNIASHIFSIHQNPAKYFSSEIMNGQNQGENVNERLQKLIDANLAKDNFLSIIAHDLKTPFSALLGISEILVDNWEDLSEANKLELIADLRKTSVDTYKLLENLLVWAKSQKEKLEVNISEVEIHSLVNSVLKISKKNASVKGIKIKNNIDVDLIVQTDENMIATVFRNLISNAVQHIQPGGQIMISTEQEKDSNIFCVADNGKGIDLPHILELFEKGSQKKLNGNTIAFSGLGLIICKDFVERNGGQIWLETQLGLGSKFFFTIPN